MEHHTSTISLSFFGKRAFQSWASDLHAISAPCSVDRSFLNTILFLLFQICQQHSSTKVWKCFTGMCVGAVISCTFITDQLGSVVIWIASQNSLAAVQPKTTWAGVSSVPWQTSHFVFSTNPFLARLDLHCILPCESSHAKNCTQGLRRRSLVLWAVLFQRRNRVFPSQQISEQYFSAFFSAKRTGMTGVGTLPVVSIEMLLWKDWWRNPGDFTSFGSCSRKAAFKISALA